VVGSGVSGGRFFADPEDGGGDVLLPRITVDAVGVSGSSGRADLGCRALHPIRAALSHTGKSENQCNE